jgi:hypothetical protein
MKQKHDWRKVDFSESDGPLFRCKNCRWPVARMGSAYPGPPYHGNDVFHIVGRWGEQTVCETAVMTNRHFEQERYAYTGDTKSR